MNFFFIQFCLARIFFLYFAREFECPRAILIKQLLQQQHHIYFIKKEKKITLDMVPSTLDMEPSTLDPRQKDRLRDHLPLLNGWVVNGNSTVFQFLIILLHEKFLQFDWLRAVIFHLKKLLRSLA